MNTTLAICINCYLSLRTVHLRACSFQLPFVPKPRCYSIKIWWGDTSDYTPQPQTLSLQATREVPGLWHGSLAKDFFNVYYLEKLLLGFLQTHLFLTVSVLWYHKQPSCFVLTLHCFQRAGIRWQRSVFHTAAHEPAPVLPLTKFLMFCSAAVRCPRTWWTDLGLGAPVRTTAISRGWQRQPETCEPATTNAAGLLLPAGFAGRTLTVGDPSPIWGDVRKIPCLILS